MGTMTSPISFKGRVEGVCALAKGAVWRTGWGGNIRTTVYEDGDRARVRVEMLPDTRDDVLVHVTDEVTAKFRREVMAAAKKLFLVPVGFGRDGFVVRARTEAESQKAQEIFRLETDARSDAHEEASIYPEPNSKLSSQRGFVPRTPRDWTASSHVEQCAGIVEALNVLRLALEPKIGSVEAQNKASGVVVRIAAASPRNDVRERAAQRLRELGRENDAGEIDRLQQPKG